MARKIATYAAQVDAMDRGIGRIVEALEEAGTFDDSLVLRCSDNGGCAEGGPYGWDGPNETEAEADHDMRPISSYGRYWANLSNTPFRRYKHWAHEGESRHRSSPTGPPASPPGRASSTRWDTSST